MISLRVPVDPFPINEPLIVRLQESGSDARSQHDATLIDIDGDRREYNFQGFSLVLRTPPDESVDGDVLLVLPGQTSAHRLIRASSRHNTLLVTEQCDQLCVMCSQPPKKYHADLFEQFAIAASLAPQDAMVGISGGEPLLHKNRLFEMISKVAVERPDIRFHILTNGQHFGPSDVETILELGTERILWGVPLYAADAPTHDQIVGKEGAFAQLEWGLVTLMRAGAAVELRTVVLQQNWEQLPELASFINTRLGFISVWAIMQLERIGFGRSNWGTSFQDTSAGFKQIGRAVDIALARGIRTSLYNFPLCSVPPEYRDFAPSTISDWKRKYLDFCTGCSARETCGGFFQWYSHNEGFVALGPL